MQKPTTTTEQVEVIANVRVGAPDVDRKTASTHVRGVFQGNRRAMNDARRSTGIRPKEHSAIDPRMPKLSPA